MTSSAKEIVLDLNMTEFLRLLCRRDDITFTR